MNTDLFIRSPDGTTQTVHLEGDRLTMGRSRNNELSFPEDASLSRSHLAFERDGEGWIVRDLGSKNGTVVDGARITGSHKLVSGSRIEAGQCIMVYGTPKERPGGEPVDFYMAPDAEPPKGTVIMTSLRGLLSGQVTGPQPPAGVPQPALRSLPFDHPVVKALIRAGRELGGNRPLPELFQLILDLSVEAVGAERALLMTLEGDKLVTQAVRGEGFRISTTVRDRVLKTGTSLLVMDVQQDESWRLRESISEQQVRTLMAVPLQTEDRVIGLIYVDSRSFVRGLTSDDLNLLTVLANVAAVRIENLRLIEVEQMEQRMMVELEQAAEIQKRLLPGRAPEVEGLDLAGHNAASRTVGGDYYDFFPYPDGRVAVVLGDVSGKGMPAALMMTGLQARVQMLSETPEDLAQLMGRLDRYVAANSPTNKFVSLFFCVLDPRAGVIRYCNAGHNPPYLVRQVGTTERLKGGGTVLGILPDLGYEERSVPFGAGDLLAIYSDGVTEAVNGEDEEYGEERLGELIAARRTSPAAEIIIAVNEAVFEWSAGAPAADDVTLVVARRIE